ncbi:hypothetical protein COCNU_10G010500 [Cocos nucifera]|uniref:JmjC domain-containing protein n=1 Tax=Cocos nucifera TaxID=13894 RepID=A0A8K0N8W3_COCNU|nr:hypothetical protein COCNU_10G010500 [Cocos nucifera]
MDFSEALALIDATGSPSSPTVAYAQQQNDCFRAEYSALAGDVEPDVPWATEALGCLPEAVNLWIGNERSETSFHKDHYENLYAVITGEKHFLLLPPTDVHRLYIRHYPAARYVLDDGKDATGELRLELEDPERQVPWCSVDPYPETAESMVEQREAFPLYFDGPKPFECTVKAGEILYLPSMWFHHVRQTPDCNGRTIAVNYWYDMQFDIKYAYFNFLQSIDYTPPGKPSAKENCNTRLGGKRDEIMRYIGDMFEVLSNKTTNLLTLAGKRILVCIKHQRLGLSNGNGKRLKIVGLPCVSMQALRWYFNRDLHTIYWVILLDHIMIHRSFDNVNTTTDQEKDVGIYPIEPIRMWLILTFIDFCLVRKKLEGDLRVVREEAAHARSKFSTIREWVTQLEGSLALKHGLIEMHQWRIAELMVELQIKEVVLKEAEVKLLSVENEMVVDKELAIAEAKMKAVEEFKPSDDFMAKVVECSSASYGFGFIACKA